jgi:ElaB/YqjD/DUF883 family membrane-anchored ribosome-binding protein
LVASAAYLVDFDPIGQAEIPMTSATEQASLDLKNLLGDFEAALTSALGDIKAEARLIDGHVRENPWVAVAMAAAAGFLIGCVAGRGAPND